MFKELHASVLYLRYTRCLFEAGDKWAPGEQLEFIPCGPILQDDDNWRMIAEAEPYPDKR